MKAGSFEGSERAMQPGEPDDGPRPQRARRAATDPADVDPAAVRKKLALAERVLETASSAEQRFAKAGVEAEAERKAAELAAVLDDGPAAKACVEKWRKIAVDLVDARTRNQGKLAAAGVVVAQLREQLEALLKAQEREEDQRLRERVAVGREERRKKLLELLTWIFVDRGMRYGVPAFNAGEVVAHELGEEAMKLTGAAVQLRQELLGAVRKEMGR